MKRLIFISLIITCILVVVDRAWGQLPGKAGERIAGSVALVCQAEIGALVDQALAAGDLPGCVIGVWKDGEWKMRQAFGDRTVEPQREPMMLDTIFDLASLTKPIATATSVMLLAERGQVDLNAPVGRYLATIVGEGRDEVLVKHLLLHTSGLIADNALADYQQGTEEAWRRLSAARPAKMPGGKFVYSDVGYLLLGRIVEVVSGNNLGDFAQENIFQPLTMRDTGFVPPTELQDRIAPTENRNGKMLRGEVHDPRAALLGGVAGHAGLFSTLDDIGSYAQMLLANGKCASTHRVLRPETIWRMTRPHVVETRESFGEVLRTYGWDQHSPYSHNGGELLEPFAFGHGGFTGTVLWIDPDQNLFYVFLSNRLHPDGQGSVNRLAGKIADLALREILSKPGNKSQVDAQSGQVQLGVDVLEARGFRDLSGRRVGLVTNQTGVNSRGQSTAEVLASAAGVELVALFSPEHGPQGDVDVPSIADSPDERLAVPIFSLYGTSRAPTAEQLAGLDVLVFDIQDIGTRFYTYISTLKSCMISAAENKKLFFVLDRPNPLGGLLVSGPMNDADRETFVACHHLALVHGMTIGELALLFRDELKLDLDLTVIPIRNWRRSQTWDQTGLEWIDPSPNMRSLEGAWLYPALGMLEATNLSVGRGTERPFQWIGAPWMDSRRLSDWFNGQNIPGIRAVPRRMTPLSSKYSGVECQGIQFVIHEASKLEPDRIGFTLAVGLRTIHPDQWEPAGIDTLLVIHSLLSSLRDGATVEELLNATRPVLDSFLLRRARCLLYE